MTKKADKRYCPEGFECGVVVLANRGYGATPVEEKEVPAYLYGSLAVHRVQGNSLGEWTVTHAATGFKVPLSWNEKETAATVAKAMAGAINWSNITRNGEKLQGWTKRKRDRVLGALHRCGVL